MQVSPQTLEILKNFATINTNLVIKVGSKIETVSATKDIIASFQTEEKFDSEVAIFNLNEFLGVISAFDKPELDLGKKSMTIKQGKQKVNYTYADESLLITPPEKGIKFPAPDITFTLKDVLVAKILKMAAILTADDMSIIGDGKKLTLKVYDKSNPLTNEFELDIDSTITDKFTVNFKIEKLKIYPGTYTVDISNKKIAKFTNDSMALVYYIAVEADSVFP